MQDAAIDALEVLSSNRNVSSRLVLEELLAVFQGAKGLAREIRLQYDANEDPRFKYRILKGVVDSTLKLGEIQHDAGQALDDQTQGFLEQIRLGNLDVITSLMDVGDMRAVDPSLEDAGVG